MKKRNQKLLSFAIIFAFVFLISTDKAQAWSPPSDLTQPFEYGGYTINMPLILAQDSVLWDLLVDLDTLRDENCRDEAEIFITAHQEEMEELFPWLWNEGDIRGGADSFCSVLRAIPTVMGEAFRAEGFANPGEGGLSTNIFDPSVVPNWHTIDGLVLDHPSVRIEFTQRINLLNYDFVYMVLAFAQAFDANTGYLALNSEMIQGLKSTGAIITFKNIENFEDPVILVNGRLDERLISALVYDPDAKTVTFNTEHFTSFEVVERSSVPVIEDRDEKSSDCKKISGNSAYKKAYQRVKYYKGHDYDHYLALQSVYKTYRTVGDTARDTLMQADITTYDKYKKYRRYHKYKECR